MIRNITRRELIAFVTLLAIIILSALIADMAKGAILKILPDKWCFKTWIFLISVLLLALFRVYRFAEQRLGRVLGSDVKISYAKTEPARKILLTGFSPLNREQLRAAEFYKAHIPFAEAVLDRESFEKFRQNFLREKHPQESQNNLAIPWQQNLRAAAHHGEKLTDILVLLPEENDEGFAAFKEFLEAMLAKQDYEVNIRPITGRDGDNFAITGCEGAGAKNSYEDYDYVYEGLRRGLDIACKKLKINVTDASNHIMIDITPGIKIFSVAAASVTLNMNLKFSYVNNAGQLRFYDASLRFRYD